MTFDFENLGFQKYQAILKNLGDKNFEFERLPYGNMRRGTFKGSFESSGQQILDRHVVPAGQQLKLLFMRWWTENTDGCNFEIVQTNPTAVGQTGNVEAFPVLGSVPAGTVDLPMLPNAGQTVAWGGLKEPLHVFEGSVDFILQNVDPAQAGGSRYGLAWWGIEN
jgi:hypothetical protein